MEESRFLKFLTEVGLDRYEAKLYAALVRRGTSTILELAKETKIDRSKVYRRVEAMIRRGLVEEIIDENRKLVRATGFENLYRLVDEQKEKIQKVEREIPQIKTFISGLVGANDPETKVVFYRGKHGIRQMVWNVLRARKEIVGYTYKNIWQFIGRKYMEDWIKEFVTRGLFFRDIISESHISNNEVSSQLAYPEYNFEARVLSDDILSITHQVDIYNDVVTFYDWQDQDIFGVEIYNKKVSGMQKQIFEALWQMGQPA